MSSSQSNKLGQIYVEWDIKTQILRYVSACLVARNSNCTMYTLCSGLSKTLFRFFEKKSSFLPGILWLLRWRSIACSHFVENEKFSHEKLHKASELAIVNRLLLMEPLCFTNLCLFNITRVKVLYSQFWLEWTMGEALFFRSDGLWSKSSIFVIPLSLLDPLRWSGSYGCSKGPEPLKHSSDDFRLLRESPSEFECSSLRKCCWQAHCDSKKRLFMNDFKIRTGILLGRSKSPLKMVCFRLAITGFNFVICFQEHQCTAVASPLDSWSYPNLALASSASIDPIGKSPNLNWKTRPEKSSNR